MRHHKLSAVIPSNGNYKINKILSNLNRNKFIDEIIVVFSLQKYPQFKLLKSKKIKYYFCKKTGQVVQRQFGFAKAKHDLVLQIDDDIIFANKDIFKLIQFKKILKNSSIGPIYYDNNKNKIHKLDKSFFGYFKRFLHWVILSVPLTSLRMGKISKIHTNYGVDPKYMKRDFLSCDWLPGGLILHEKKNLVLKNYYPFKGKAIGEDILHSKILLRKGIKLYVIKKSSVFTNPQENTNREFVKKYFKFLNYINIKKTRLYIWKFVFYFGFVIRNK